MNYRENYFKLIEKAKNRKELPKVCEIHHIIPKSIGGSDDKNNLIILTLKEHYLAHYLLCKFTSGEDRNKMLCAFMLMSGFDKYSPSAKKYEELRFDYLCSIGKKIICLQNLIVFNSIRNASLWLINNNKLNTNYNTISKEISSVLNNKRKSCHGYIFEEYDENKKYVIKEKSKNINFSDNNKRIICLQDLKVYDSARQAGEFYKIDFRSISRSAINNISTKGYDFRFYKEDTEYIKKPLNKIHSQENRKIICSETGEVFNSLSSLGKYLNINRTTITKYINNNKPYDGKNYHFI